MGVLTVAGVASLAGPASAATSAQISGGTLQITGDATSEQLALSNQAATFVLDGDDTLRGGAGPETFIGGSGDDFVDGNIGADTVDLGSGNDRDQWDPGDGSDTIEGAGGNDALDFNGSNANERIDVTANGSRVRLARDVASIDMDLNDLEQVRVLTLGGNDDVTVDPNAELLITPVIDLGTGQ
jgi:Ca2+-binding RTX toxin-like protein